MFEQESKRLHGQYAKAVEDAARGHVGVIFRSSVNVRVRKPRWMPSRIYRALMRTIIVEETLPKVEDH